MYIGVGFLFYIGRRETARLNNWPLWS